MAVTFGMWRGCTASAPHASPRRSLARPGLVRTAGTPAQGWLRGPVEAIFGPEVPMNMGEVVSELSKLVSLEVDAVDAYDAAVAAVGGAGTVIASEMDLFKVEHQQHALELCDAFL